MSVQPHHQRCGGDPRVPGEYARLREHIEEIRQAGAEERRAADP
jgi:hypothetical protein